MNKMNIDTKFFNVFPITDVVQFKVRCQIWKVHRFKTLEH